MDRGLVLHAGFSESGRVDNGLHVALSALPQSHLRRPLWIRFVPVPGLTDDDLDDMAKSAAFAASLGNVERVEVLPFHQMGRFKWERLGLDYTLRDVEPPTAGAVEQACAVWRAAGLKVS